MSSPVLRERTALQRQGEGWAESRPCVGYGTLTDAAHQSFSHSVRRGFLLVGATGIEPVAPAMSRQCSPAELRAHPRNF
jgi:hypothetical protein